MRSPFRDLFVALPTAVFEMLQGIGEAAVEQARSRGRTYSRAAMLEVPAVLLTRDVRQMLERHYDWQKVETAYRSETECSIVYIVRLGCGHRHRFDVDEMGIMFAGPCDIMDVIDGAAVKNLPCYCVPRRSW